MKSAIEMKPCPFCGGEAELGRDEDGYFVIGCADSDCFAYIFRSDLPNFYMAENAIAAWNTRFAAPAERGGA